MVKLIFTYEGKDNIIPSNANESIKEIFKRYSILIGINIHNIYFLYNGNKINENLNFNEIANSEDKRRNIMNILVFKNDNYQKERSLFKSIDIICPICKEYIFIKIINLKN